MQHNYPARSSTHGDDLAAQVEALAAQVAQLTTALSTLASDAPHPYAGANVVIHERRRYNFEAKLPAVRKVVDYRSHNTVTGTTISIADYSARQIERFAHRFARLPFPCREHWQGNRDAYGLMVKLFAQHSAITRHGASRMWRWCAWPHVRREIAARIVASITHPTASKSAK